MPGVDDLQAAAQEYLDACVAALDELTTAGAPAYRFVSHGPPALDCPPMLTVHVGNAAVAGTALSSGALSPGHRIALTGVVEQIQLTATIIRCVPASEEGEALPASVLTAVAVETNRDAWAIVNWLINRKRDGSLFAPDYRELAIGNAVARTVEGLCAGWLIPITVGLDGFALDPIEPEL